MTTTFASLGLPDALVEALRSKGITEPFPVQEATIPDALAGLDVSGKAPTGSGKTFAFGLPLLATVDEAKPKRPRALILAPTRELAEQIKQDLAPMASGVGRSVFAIYGGVGYGPQLKALRRGVDVLVATPGRLEDLMESRSVELGDVSIAVIDEGDRMADMGFLPAVRRILDTTARDRQTLLFSATLDGDVAVLSRDYQRDPRLHEADPQETDAIDATHHFWLVDRTDRVQQTADVVGRVGRTVVFTRTRHGADRLAKQLGKQGVDAVAMHGGRSQNQRTRSLSRFSSGQVDALIATDVAARGIHVDGIGCVIHFDPPEDAKTYIHRSGRTARAGATGLVVSLVSPDQQRASKRMQRDLDLEVSIDRPRLDALETGGRRISTGPSQGERQRPDTRRPAGKATTLYVANIPFRSTHADIANLFGRHGKVHDTTIITDRKTGRSRGFGFVEMAAADIGSAIDQLHGTNLDGRPLTVRLAQPKKTGNKKRR